MRFDADMRVTAEAVSLPSHPEAADQDANLFRTSTGRLLQYGFLWYPVTREIAEKLKELGRPPVIKDHMGCGFIYWASYVRYSDDDGHTWSDHNLMPSDPLLREGEGKYFPCSGPMRGRMIERPDGSLLIACYQGRLAAYVLPIVRFFLSTDNGQSWQLQDTLVSMPGITLAEPALACWPEGQVTAFHRTGHNDDRLVIASSSDEARSFGAPETVEVKGHPYDPLVLPDGRLFLSYGYRHDPMGVRARLVEKGQAIVEAEEIIIRDDSASRDTGYPSATLLPGGQILLAYYIADDRGIRGIDGTIVDYD